MGNDYSGSLNPRDNNVYKITFYTLFMSYHHPYWDSTWIRLSSHDQLLIDHEVSDQASMGVIVQIPVENKDFRSNLFLVKWGSDFRPLINLKKPNLFISNIFKWKATINFLKRYSSLKPLDGKDRSEWRISITWSNYSSNTWFSQSKYSKPNGLGWGKNNSTRPREQKIGEMREFPPFLLILVLWHSGLCSIFGAPLCRFF